MLSFMLYLVFLQNVSSQLLGETSTTRILKRVDRLEDDVLVIRKAVKEESDLCREDISTLSNELRNLRKYIDEERELRRGDIPTVSNRLTESSGEDVRHEKEPVATSHHGSCDCGAIVSKYKKVMNAFKSEKSENIMLRKKFDEMRNEQYFESGNVREKFNYVDTRFNSAEKALRSEIKLIHERYDLCQHDVNYTRAFFNDGFMRVNESLTNRSLSALQEISRLTSDIANLKTSNEILKNVSDHLQRLHPNSCDTVEKNGEYNIYTSSYPNGIMVYCSKDSTNRGWIVIQRRANGSVEFNRTWADYKAGFGDLSGDFWLGNEHIYQLTKNKPRELMIDMETFDGRKRYALYSKFSISPESEKYKLHVAGYTGDAGDGLETNSAYTHNGQSFSTFDADNDIWPWCCASVVGAGWWHKSCFSANLNGKYVQESDTVLHMKAIIWHPLTDYTNSLKFVEMNIR